METLAAAIERDAAVLVETDPRLRGCGGGTVRVQLRGPTFGTLTWLILGQQVSVAAARALYGRLTSLAGEVTPEALLGLDDAVMRSCGFTRQKAGYIRAIARRILDGDFCLGGLDGLADGDAVELLTSLRGVGRWTAENYLLWGMGRRDVFPANDLALRAGWRDLTGSAETPAADELRATARRWSPRRTAAAILIWDHYVARRSSR